MSSTSLGRPSGNSILASATLRPPRAEAVRLWSVNLGRSGEATLTNQTVCTPLGRPRQRVLAPGALETTVFTRCATSLAHDSRWH